jgi:capsular exopolysaccharide synthesis family protein
MSKIFEALKKAGEEGQDILAVFQDEELAPRYEQAAAVSAEQPAAKLPPAPAPPPLEPAPLAYRPHSLRLTVGTPVIPFDGLSPRAADQYRMIRTHILHHPGAPRMLLVSSPTPGDGKTTTAINIACALALKSNTRVLLVDGDLRRPGVAPILGLPEEPGLANILDASASFEDAVAQIVEIPGLFVLPAGKTDCNPTELLDSRRFTDVWATARQAFDYVVIDTSPVSVVADYDLLEKAADGVVIVVRPDHTNRSLAFKALESIPSEKNLGLVVNRALDWFLFRPDHPYYYHDYR